MRLTHKIENVLYYRKNDTFFIFITKNKKLNIVEKQKFSDIDTVEIDFLSYDLKGDFIFSYGLKIYDIISKKVIYSKEEGLNYELQVFENLHLVKHVNDSYSSVTFYIFDRESFSKKQIGILGNPFFSHNGYILTYYVRKEKNIHKYDIEGNLLWQIDLEKIGDYYDETNEKDTVGRIATWAMYDNSLIVVIGHSVIAIDFETGKMKWHQAESNQYLYIMVFGNKAILSGSAAYQWINLETGDFESEMIILEQFNDGEYDLWPSGFQLKYHSGNIWHSVFNRSKRFLGKYDPETGKLLDKYDFPNGDNLSSPEFQANKIFVNTSEGNLYILENEPNA